MDILRSVLGGGSSSASTARGTSSSAETIERLVDRLVNSTLLEDRRDACRALKAMSRKFRVEVGVQALEHLTEILEEDRNDEEILSYALDTLCNIVSPEDFDEEEDSKEDVGEQFTEIYLKRPRNVQSVLDLLADYEFKVRRPSVRLLAYLLTNKPREMQELVLASQMGVSRLMDILADQREVLRNDALLLMIQLTKGNANLQKIVAFENAFDKLIDIIQVEGYSDGGIVVEDCLRLMLSLLRNNSSNQTFFREGSYIQKINPFFDLQLENSTVEVGWSAQKVSNMLHMLLVLRTLVSPSNSTSVISSCQTTIESCGLLNELCRILMANGIPADVLTETINTISEVIRGNLHNQTFYAGVQAPSKPPRPAIILLLMSMVNEKQPYSLRCAVLYCFQCFLHNNPAGQHDVLRSLLPARPDNGENSCSAPNGGELVPSNPGDISAGQLLCGGLFAVDTLSNWFSSVALAHALMDQDRLKVDLLRVQLSLAGGNTSSNVSLGNGVEPVSLLLQCTNILQQSPHLQTKIGLLMLLSTWIADCPKGVSQLLSIRSVVPFLTGQISSNEHDEMVRLSQGLCSYLLGLCVIVGNENSELIQLIEKRIGYEVFMDKLSEISKHESYNKALKHPQIKCSEARDLTFDYKWCKQFKHLEHSVTMFLSEATTSSNSEKTVVDDPHVLRQYKDLIREQDSKIRDISNANIYLQNELSAAKQQVEEFTQLVQSLQDQNFILRQANLTVTGSDGQETAAVAAPIKVLQKELQMKDEIINELKLNLAHNRNDEETEGNEVKEGEGGSDIIKMETLKSQLNSLRATIGKKEQELEKLQSTLEEREKSTSKLQEEFNALQEEQEDLLIMLADQDAKISQYKKRLVDLGEKIEEEDEEDLGLDEDEDEGPS